MSNRKGEKAGWIGGWAGGYIWIAVLAVLFLCQDNTAAGLAGIGIFMLGIISVFQTAPWKHPSTPYWKLLIPLYLIIMLGVLWCFWSYGLFSSTNFKIIYIFWIIPLFSPFLTIGRKTWDDHVH